MHFYLSTKTSKTSWKKPKTSKINSYTRLDLDAVCKAHASLDHLDDLDAYMTNLGRYLTKIEATDAKLVARYHCKESAA